VGVRAAELLLILLRVFHAGENLLEALRGLLVLLLRHLHLRHAEAEEENVGAALLQAREDLLGGGVVALGSVELS